jgi:hypothetical protein
MLFCIVSARSRPAHLQYYFRLPESPRWLASNGRHAETLAVLAALDNKPVTDPEVLQTWHGICDAVAAEAEGGFNMRMLTTSGKSQHLRRTLLGIAAQCFQQSECGWGEADDQFRGSSKPARASFDSPTLTHSLITYYLTSVLRQIGLDALMSRVISGVNGTTYFLTSLIAIAIIERVGRRPLMLWMAAFQAATMAVLAGLYNYTDTSQAARVISVLCLFLFNTWFSIGWLGMTW